MDKSSRKFKSYFKKINELSQDTFAEYSCSEFANYKKELVINRKGLLNIALEYAADADVKNEAIIAFDEVLDHISRCNKGKRDFCVKSQDEWKEFKSIIINAIKKSVLLGQNCGAVSIDYKPFTNLY